MSAYAVASNLRCVLKWLPWIGILAIACAGTDDGSRDDDSCASVGQLSVEVFDASDQPVDVDSIQVTLDGEETGLPRRDTGNYGSDLKPGEYTITIEACGGDQVIEETVLVLGDSPCTDTDAPDAQLTYTLDPC